MASDAFGDQRQFSEYFAARRDVVRRTAYLLCGDWHWADDLTQTAFMRLALRWRKVRDHGALDAFVRTCLLRAYLAETRRAWRRRELSHADVPDTRAGPDAMEQSTARTAFIAALGELAPRQRAVLVCRFYHDLDVAATAEALGCSEGTVKTHASRGLARLRTLLGDDLERLPATMTGDARDFLA
ncbi:SigE family RNA polymerase sigma factor [Dactylosporangium sp. AC04546]|uniref:SigE family RNA polymerase sigma factor n=1 Tax=Dactylosporangium sp. AC04546 TaxID=2862460 RepID=UPI001EDDCCF7|nr:SigE family RNA polymerase sigma factor [Dactylosporangium sp. AC04546]WVK86401.1 SigE family RNA polymerase sigma factor [Dactylosporangium sp. AC04546]